MDCYRLNVDKSERLKILGGPSHTVVSFYLRELYQVLSDWRKIPFCFQQREEKQAFCNIREQSIPKKLFPKEKPFHQSLLFSH